MESKEDKKKELISQCRFFNDEKEAPDSLNQNEKMFWFYEQHWVNGNLQDHHYTGYIQDHPSMKEFEVGDGTPQDLKALICDRYCHFGGTDEGFKDFYKKEYQVRLTNKERIERAWELRHCRLYKGEGDNEYEQILRKPMSFREPTDGYNENKADEEIKQILAIFYSGEYYWVKLDKKHCISKNTHAISQFEYDLGEDFELNDGAPRGLQIVLFHCFLDYVDGVYHRFNTGYEVDLFKSYYKEYYQPIQTPNQKREQERRPGLIDKCKYYKGEEENPWEYCYSPVLDYRKNIWEVEKEWADAMVVSYNCPQSNKQLIKDFVLEEFFKAKGMALSLVNMIVFKQKEKAEANKEYFGPAEAIKAIEKYEKMAPLGRDHRLYFAFYLGEENCPYGYDEEEYKRMGWSQESLQKDHCHSMCDFDSKDFQKKYRGKEGIWGWYADPKFPKLQKDVLFFNICNWGRWCPYCDEDKLAEEYLNYHYPGDGKPKHSDRFYHNAALQLIKDEEYYKTVRKCGVYEGKRAYEPILKDEYKKEPPCIGLPLVILVDDEGNAEYIRDFLSFEIYDEIRKKSNKKK